MEMEGSWWPLGPWHHVRERLVVEVTGLRIVEKKNDRGPKIPFKGTPPYDWKTSNEAPPLKGSTT